MYDVTKTDFVCYIFSARSNIVLLLDVIFDF